MTGSYAEWERIGNIPSGNMRGICCLRTNSGMTGHITSQEVSAYRSGVSELEELLRLDDHLAECGECRSLVAQATEDAATGVRALRIDFSSPHLTEAQLDDYAARRPMPSDLVQHLDLCPRCRADADDLRQYASENTQLPARSIRPVWMRPLAAGIAVAALEVAAPGLTIRLARACGSRAVSGIGVANSAAV